MKVWYNGAHIEMYVGQMVTVYRCGLGQKVYGEPATLNHTTKRYLVFTTHSGAVVKTKLDNLHATIDRAKESGYCVTPKPVDAFPRMIHEEVRFWDKASCTFVKNNEEDDTLKLTENDKKLLLSWGQPTEDFPQIEEALQTRYTRYTLDNRPVSREDAVAALGREKFLSGIARSACHRTAARETGSGEIVYFDSSSRRCLQHSGGASERRPHGRPNRQAAA